MIQTLYLRGDKIDQRIAHIGAGDTKACWTLLDRQVAEPNRLTPASGTIT